MTEPLIHPEFSQPWLISADVVLDIAGAATDEGEIDANDFFNLPYPCLVEKVMLFENSIRDPAADPGADTILLPGILGRWWRLKRQNSSNQNMPIPAYDDAQIHRVLPVIHGPQEPRDWAALGIRFAPGQLTVPLNGILDCAWENPAATSGLHVPAGTVHLALKCRSKQSRMPVTLYLPVSILISTTGPTGVQYYTASSKNPWDEELEVQDLRIWLDGVYGPNVAWADTRTLRHILLRPLIQPGNISVNGATNYIPAIGFGMDRVLDHAVSLMDFSDEPLEFDPYDGMSFRFENLTAVKTRVTVVAKIRRMPL